VKKKKLLYLRGLNTLPLIGNTTKYCLQSVQERLLEEFRKCARESVEKLVEERKTRLKERYEVGLFPVFVLHFKFYLMDLLFHT
jgi:hypothetical protein